MRRAFIFTRGDRSFVPKLFLLLILNTVLLAPTGLPAAWLAFNDQQQGPISNTNDTFYSAPGVPGPSAGPLRDVATGTNLPVSLTITNVGAISVSASMGAPAPGTPAYDLFNAYIDWQSSGPNNGVQVAAENVFGYTVSGLDTNALYRFSATSIRGASPGSGSPNFYSNRWTQVELVGAASAIPAHSANVIDASAFPGDLSGNQVAFNTGVNTNGQVVQWDNIVPGSDGTFTVLSTKYSGHFPGSGANTANASHAYTFTAIRLEKLPPLHYVTITAPAEGMVFAAPAAISLAAAATGDPLPTNVQFYANEVLLGESGPAPFSLLWSNLVPGAYQLMAVAQSSSGSVTSAMVNITVVSNALPTVAIINPTNNAVYTTQDVLPISADAGDSDGALVEVSFYADALLLGTRITSPFTWTWKNMPAGSYLITAVVTDNLGASVTSAPVAITVTETRLLSWVAFNEQQKGPRSNPNNSFYTLSSFGANSGPLSNILTGVSLPVALTITNAPGASAASSMAAPLAGTPAYNAFFADTDWLGPGTGPVGIDLYATNVIGYAFSSLATDMLYRLTATAIRGGSPGSGGPNYYSNRWTQAELLGARSYVPAHSGGVITSNDFPTDLSNSQAAFNAGVNTDGDILQWDNIVPGPDGTFTILCTKYSGAIPGGLASADHTYALAAIRLQQMPVPATIALLTPTNGLVHYSPNDLVLEAAASSPNGISNVQFYANNLLLGASSAAPYRFVWSSPSIGLHQLVAIATDTLGVCSTSAAVNIAIDLPVTDSSPPAILSVSPTNYYISNALTTVEVTFSRLVTGVDATDLLINAIPATVLTGSGSNYLFSFPEPPFGPVAITWASNHGITDLAPEPHSFDATAANWEYLTLDAIRPLALSVDPPPYVTVRSLTRIAITFSEPVSGVQAGDLLINNLPAREVRGSGAGPYYFYFDSPQPGPVQVSWSAGQQIRDLAYFPNPFSGGTWSYLLDPAISSALAVSHVIHISVDGLGGVYLQDYLSNSPAQFPNFARMAREGAWTCNARTDNDDTVTIPNHTCMLTGRPLLQPSGQLATVHHGYTGDFPSSSENLQITGNLNVSYKASSLDVVHDRGLSTSFYASKNKFGFYIRSWDATYGALDVLGQDNGRNKIDFSMLTEGANDLYGSSETLVDSVTYYITNAPWNYTFLHFSEPDYAGHSYGWGSATWKAAVQHVDQQLGRILNAIDSQPALSNQFALVLTADHGGGGNSSTGHSTYTALKNYTIPLFVWGSGIRAGADLYTLFLNRADPGANRVDYIATPQPLRNGDSGNISLTLLGLPPIPDSFIRPVMGEAPVSLAVSNVSGTTILSWPANAQDYFLESTTELASPPVWQTITEGISISGTLKTYAITNSTAGPMQFYRLRKD